MLDYQLAKDVSIEPFSEEEVNELATREGAKDISIKYMDDPNKPNSNRYNRDPPTSLAWLAVPSVEGDRSMIPPRGEQLFQRPCVRAVAKPVIGEPGKVGEVYIGIIIQIGPGVSEPPVVGESRKIIETHRT